SGNNSSASTIRSNTEFLEIVSEAAFPTSRGAGRFFRLEGRSYLFPPDGILWGNLAEQASTRTLKGKNPTWK
ncbi:MAG: hypothetical protein V3U53_04530, partial [bacterium]